LQVTTFCIPQLSQSCPNGLGPLRLYARLGYVTSAAEAPPADARAAESLSSMHRGASVAVVGDYDPNTEGSA